MTYEELPAALSPEDALAPNAAVIHEHAADYIKVFDAGTSGNLCRARAFGKATSNAAGAKAI